MKVLIIAAFTLFLVGCGQAVEVPPAHVGKILTKNGYAPETVTPSKFRLPFCVTHCDRLILMEASDSGFRESMKLFMPKDKLNIQIDVRGTLSVPSDSSTVDSVFDRVVADKGVITVHQVYGIYGQQAVRGIVRSELVKYTIGEILEQREVIGQSIHTAITEKLRSTKIPLIVSRFELADVQPPAVIVEAQQAAKEREVAIQRAEADARVQLVQAEKDLEIAKKNRLVEREKALAIAEQNEIAAESITPQLLAYRRLEVAEKVYSDLSRSPGSVIIVPADSGQFSDLSDDAVLAKMLGKELKK